jgi:hypothetical protein
MPPSSPTRDELRRLTGIPGVGFSIASDLRSLGIRSPEDLRGKNPERLYTQLCVQKGGAVDRCVLYVLRTAVYYSSRRRHDPKLLTWWNWKDPPSRRFRNP